MITRITRVAIFQTGKHLAAWYGFMALVIFLPMFLIFLAYSPENIVILIFGLMLYPMMGFLGGVLAATIYNLASSITGGLEVTLETVEEFDHPPLGESDRGDGARGTGGKGSLFGQPSESDWGD